MEKLVFFVKIEDLVNKEYPFIRNEENIVVDETGCPIDESLVNLPRLFLDNERFGVVEKTATFTIPLTQRYDEIGIYDDLSYIEYTGATTGIEDPLGRDYRLTIDSYTDNGNYYLTGLTDNKLDAVTSYYNNNPYVVGLNLSDNPSLTFNGVLENTNQYVKYVIGGDVDTLGLYIPNTGIIYTTYFTPRLVYNSIIGEYEYINYTEFAFFASGRTVNAYSLNNIVKNEGLFGIVEPIRISETYSVDRGNVSIIDKYIRMSEVKNIDQLVDYGNGYFTINE